MKSFQERWTLKKAQLLNHKDDLTTKGTIQRKGGSSFSYYALRWREKSNGKVVKRTIYLGTELMAAKAQELIDKWRSEEEEKKRSELAEIVKEFRSTMSFHGLSGNKLFHH